uniref:Uncharacterized protein n=1 Tax=Pristionchus pacificus TaxID=54126 RepID=A0A2A6CUH6_PRIPA|eukprot:PDM81835.1 hypothetical protein PRIPAC_33989 [Pristionchus pacificus]
MSDVDHHISPLHSSKQRPATVRVKSRYGKDEFLRDGVHGRDAYTTSTFSLHARLDNSLGQRIMKQEIRLLERGK